MSFLYFLGSVILFFIVSTLTQSVYSSMQVRHHLPSWIPIVTAVVMLLSLTYLGFHWFTVIVIGVTTGMVAARADFSPRYRI